MIQSSWKLWEIVKKAHDSRIWRVGDLFELENEWHHHLIAQGIGVDTISDPSRLKNVAERRLYRLSLESGDDRLACLDPMRASCSDFCGILLFPKELADKILIFGHMPMPEDVEDLA